MRLRRLFLGTMALLYIGSAAAIPQYSFLDLGQATGIDLNNHSDVLLEIDKSVTEILHTQTASITYVPLYNSPVRKIAAITALNDQVQILGEYTERASLIPHGFVTAPNGGEPYAALVDKLGGYTTVKALNNSAQVVGSSNGQAFVTGPDGRDMQSLQISNSSSANDINDRGQITGDNAGTSAFFINGLGQSARNLDTLGGKQIYANALNSLGQVVGTAQLANEDTFHAFITAPDGLGIKDLGTLAGFSNSRATAINDAGQVIGYASNPNGTLSQKGLFLSLSDTSGLLNLNDLVTLPDQAYLTEARAINNAGQILVNASNGHSYLLTPSIPEPATYLLVLIGLGGAIALTRLRR